jgi:hypothetical protein
VVIPVSDADHESSDSETFDEPAEVLVELGRALEKTRTQRLEADPENRKEAYLSGYEAGLREAVMAFEDLDEFKHADYLPEWQIGLENEEEEWEWYYPHAVSRERRWRKPRSPLATISVTAD